MLKRALFILVFTVLIVVVFPFVVMAQDADTARIRIGYFAFDPRTVDTYIDGEIASFSDGWAHIRWNESPFPMFQLIRTKFTTPYVRLPAGPRSFAFVPKGEDLDSAILGPIEVVLEADHTVALAIVGHNDDFDLVVSDETVALAGADPNDHFIFNFVHNLWDGPPVDEAVNNQLTIENLAYGNLVTTIKPAGSAYSSITATGDRSIVFLSGAAKAIPGISNFAALFGEYPGTPGVDYFITYDWDYTGEVTVLDAGSVVVGDELSGTIEEIAQRVRYTLILEDDAALNIYARATGDRYPDSWDEGPFDSSLVIYDADGSLLFWNDELIVTDNTRRTLDAFDAGLEGVSLTAGNYIVEVAGAVDIIVGPYRLIIESAATE
jgi:hypothetical protein